MDCHRTNEMQELMKDCAMWGVGGWQKGEWAEMLVIHGDTRCVPKGKRERGEGAWMFEKEAYYLTGIIR